MNYLLPDGFEPFEDLEVCSNHFINGISPITLSDQPILLIGKGDFPRVWLSLPESLEKAKTGQWIYVVKDNKPSRKNVDIKFRTNTIFISLGISIIIEINKLSDEAAKLSWLDLRPLGLNIFGDENELNVGGTKLKDNHFKDIRTMLEI